MKRQGHAVKLVIELSAYQVVDCVDDTGVVSMSSMGMSSMGMVGIGVLLIILGILLLTGIIQALLTFVGWIGIIAGVVISAIGLVGMIRGSDNSY